MLQVVFPFIFICYINLTTNLDENEIKEYKNRLYIINQDSPLLYY